MGKSIANIDGKNVNTDWLEDIFFNECCVYACVYGKNKQAGYINGDLVEVEWDSCTFTWCVFSGNESTIRELTKRLSESMEDYPEESPRLTTEVKVVGNKVLQQFFWED